MQAETENICIALIIQYGDVLMVQQDGTWRFPQTHVKAPLNPFESLELSVQETLDLDIVTQEVFFEHQDNGTLYASIFALPMDDGIAHARDGSPVKWLAIDTLEINQIYPPHQPIAIQLKKDYS